MRVSTDVGGTFTDYVFFENNKINAFKTLTTKDPSKGILKEIGEKNISEFSHGTTAAVNAVIEKKGAPVIFFTTKGFKDIVNIGRQTRKNIYSFICETPKIPVKHIVEIEERTLSSGDIIKKLNIDNLKEEAKVKYSGHEPVAVIGFLNSYVNPKNEIQAEKFLSDYFATVIPSYKVRREIREYERFSTAIVDGYISPLINNYLKNLDSISKNFYVMQSNGGKSDIQNLRTINMLMSGPAGGTSACEVLCKKLGLKNAIAFDMGGTSADVSAIVNGSPLYTDTIQVSDIPIKTLAIDIESIGAGGGSIAWIDDGGILKVGPTSSGSIPGPACYNLGGKEFTVSDANLLNGILGSKISEINLIKNKAIKASKSICNSLNIDSKKLSSGVLKIVNNNMVSAIKRISIGRGYDPRDFTLISFGGAGPMHACALADSIGIKHIIIPPFAGVFSAFGIMFASVRFNYIQTILSSIENSENLIQNIINDFHLDLKEKLSNNYENIVCHLSLDLRYKGQGHQINVPLTDDFESIFHKKHHSLFGFNMKSIPIEVVNIKMVAEMPSLQFNMEKKLKKIPKKRDVREVGSLGEVNIYFRDFYNSEIEGPCIIEEKTTTTLVDKNWKVYLDYYDIMHLERD